MYYIIGDSTDHVDCVELLLQFSTEKEINMTTEDMQQTAVILASTWSRKNVLQTLLCNNAVDVFFTDRMGRNALHWAVIACTYLSFHA